MLLASLANGCVRLLYACRLARSIHKRKFRQGLGMVGSPDATTNGRGKSMTQIHREHKRRKMMKRTILIAAFAAGSHAQAASWHRLWRVTQAAMLASTTADVASRSQKEKNDETNNSDRSLRRWLSCSSGLMAPPLARHPSGNAGQHYG